MPVSKFALLFCVIQGLWKNYCMLFNMGLIDIYIIDYWLMCLLLIIDGCIYYWLLIDVFIVA